MGMAKYFTRTKANEGKKVFLKDPSTGERTEDWVIIRHYWSDTVKAAIHEYNQLGAAKESIQDEAQKTEFEHERILKMQTAFIAGWSFEDELTPENVRTFLYECPQVEELVTELGFDNQSFFGQASAISLPGSEKK